jgi:nucleotide-binding universal stress UspA family protein
MGFAALAHILVAVDGSYQARRACHRAADLACRYGARLTALYVAVPVMRSSFDRARTALQAEAASRTHGQHVLEEARAIAASYAPFAATLVFGDPAQRICQLARELNVDLIVVGSRGLSAIDRVLLGSVSAAVVRRAPCSVLVIRESPSDSRAYSCAGP